MISQTFFRQRAAAIRHAVRISHADPFQAVVCVRLPAVPALCELATCGFPALCEDMQDATNRADVGAFVREVNEARARVDCGAWDAAFHREVMRAVRRAYVATAN